MYVVNNYIVCLFVQGTAEKQLADAVSLVKKIEKKIQPAFLENICLKFHETFRVV